MNVLSYFQKLKYDLPSEAYFMRLSENKTMYIQQHRQQSILKTIILCLTLSLFCFTVNAAEDLPLEIDADSSNCGTNLEDCTLSGNVVIKQGDAIKQKSHSKIASYNLLL